MDSDQAVGRNYLTAYAKITEDKQTGIEMLGVFFGGLSQTHEEAEKIAKECVNTIKGGTIIPKIMPIDGERKLISAMKSMDTKFLKVVQSMMHASDIMSSKRRRS